MKKNAKGKKTASTDAVGLSDDRFSHLQSDPRFSGLSNKNKKVVIEKRFAAALTDAKFSSRARVDKRGRRMKKTTGNELLDLYEVEKDEDEEEEDTQAKKAKIEASGSDEDDESDDEGPVKVDLARGEGNLSSSDESDSEESDWEIGDNVQMEMDLAHLDQDAERVEWASRRLAACNLDWNLVRAEDIMILVNSFKPAGGRVLNISIYLSDFGKERLDEEEKHGPRLQLSKPIEDYQEDDELDPETRLAIRKYQLDLLKYYYAVIECDSEETATAIYEQCDGFQFESSGLKMDLRFVPDDMEFEEDRLKEKVGDGDVNLDKYRSKENVRSGVTLTEGRLAWDENDDTRAKAFQDAFSKDDGGAAGDLIAASDSEDDETVEKRRQALLSLLHGNEEDEGLQVDWDEKEDSSDVKKEKDEDSDGSDIEKALARRDADGGSESEEEEEAEVPVEEEKKEKKKNFKNYLEKKKEKRRERKQKLKEAREAQREELNEVGKEAKKRQKEEKQKKQAKAEKEDTVEQVAADDRFKALFTDSSFAIEQSSKEFKGSKLIEKQAAVKKDSKIEAKSGGDDLLSKLKQKANKWEQRKKK